MMRHCGKCGSDFDDECHLTLCPHMVGERAQVVGSNPVMDTLDELISIEMEELLWELQNSGVLPSFPPHMLTRES